MSSKLKEFVELLVGAISIVSVIGAAGFWLAALQIRKELQNCDTTQSARFQRQYDRNKIKIGILEARVKSIEKFLQGKLEFHERELLSEEALPSEEETKDLGEFR